MFVLAGAILGVTSPARAQIPTIDSIEGFPSYSPGAVKITGSGFSGNVSVLVDDIPAFVTSQSSTAIVFMSEITEVGFHDLAVQNPDGTAAVALDGLRSWPALTSASGFLGSTLDVELDNGGPGSYFFGFSLSSLADPLVFEPVVFNPVWLDLSAVQIADIGSIPPSGKASISAPVPNLPVLTGLEIPLQALVTDAGTGIDAVTNLAFTVLAPLGSCADVELTAQMTPSVFQECAKTSGQAAASAGKTFCTTMTCSQFQDCNPAVCEAKAMKVPAGVINVVVIKNPTQDPACTAMGNINFTVLVFINGGEVCECRCLV